MSRDNDFDNVFITTYVINLSDRTDRLEHTYKQFKERTEFDLNIIKAQKHEIGAVGLWQNIVKIVEIAVDTNEDVIIICEDDHEFTTNYSKEFLIQNIFEGHQQGACILSGGISGFDSIIPLTPNRALMNFFWGTQFIVIYKSFFQAILEESFSDQDTADEKFSKMTKYKMVLYPFISVQKDFGYSDVTKNNNIDGEINRLFSFSEKRMGEILRGFETPRQQL